MSTLRRVTGSFLIAACLGAMISCDSNDEKLESAELQNEDQLAVVIEAIRYIDQYEQKIDQNLLLNKLRDQEKKEIQDHLYWIKVALYRLKKNLDDEGAGQVLGDSIEALSKSRFLVSDYNQFLTLIDFLKDGVLKTLEIAYFRDLFTEEFTDSTNLGAFQSISVAGGVAWSTSDDRGYAKVSAFGKSGTVDSWLISPILNLSGVSEPTMKIRQAVGFLKTWEGLEVLISANYKGGNPGDADWEAVEIEERPSGSKNWEWVSSEVISLEKYIDQEIVFAFHYNVPAKDAPTWEIEYLKVRGISAGDFQPTPLDLSDVDGVSGGTVEAGGSSEGSNPPAGSSDKKLKIMLEPQDDDIFYLALDQASIDESGMKAISLKGEYQWRPKTDKAGYPVGFNMSGFKDESGANEDYLLSPAIDLSSAVNPYLQIAEFLAFVPSLENVKVVVSSNYEGDVTKASWDVLDIHHSKDTDKKPVVSKKADLSAYVGKSIVIGFYYTSENASKAGNWSVSEILVGENKE